MFERSSFSRPRNNRRVDINSGLWILNSVQIFTEWSSKVAGFGVLLDTWISDLQEKGMVSRFKAQHFSATCFSTRTHYRWLVWLRFQWLYVPAWFPSFWGSMFLMFLISIMTKTLAQFFTEFGRNHLGKMKRNMALFIMMLEKKKKIEQ